MKVFKKQIPYIFYAILLFSITVVCVLIAKNSPISATAVTGDNGKTENNAQITVDNGNGDGGTDDTPTDGNTDESVINKKTYDGKIPRSAESSAEYLYSQHIFGNGDTELKDVFSTSLGIYVTAVTTSSDGDIRGDGSAVGILRLDTSGSIVSALSLDFSYAHEYVSAQITSCGIVVATSPEDKSYLYLNIVPYDLSGSSAYRISYAESAVIFPTDTSFIIFAEYSDECLAYSYSENGFAFQSIGTGKVAELFEYGSYYVIISNDTAQNRYSVIKLAKNTFNVISCAETDGATVISVTPVIADGTQYFIVLENKNGVVAKKFDSTLTKQLAVKKLGNFDVRGVFPTENSLLIVCSGNVSGIAALDFDLVSVFTETQTAYAVKDVLDSAYIGGVLYCLTTDSDKKLALMHSENGTTSMLYFEAATDEAKLVYNINGTFTVLYQSSDEIKIFGIPKP